MQRFDATAAVDGIALCNATVVMMCRAVLPSHRRTRARVARRLPRGRLGDARAAARRDGRGRRDARVALGGDAPAAARGLRLAPRAAGASAGVQVKDAPPRRERTRGETVSRRLGRPRGRSRGRLACGCATATRDGAHATMLGPRRRRPRRRVRSLLPSARSGRKRDRARERQALSRPRVGETTVRGTRLPIVVESLRGHGHRALALRELTTVHRATWRGCCVVRGASWPPRPLQCSARARSPARPCFGRPGGPVFPCTPQAGLLFLRLHEEACYK